MQAEVSRCQFASILSSSASHDSTVFGPASKSEIEVLYVATVGEGVALLSRSRRAKFTVIAEQVSPRMLEYSNKRFFTQRYFSEAPRAGRPGISGSSHRSPLTLERRASCRLYCLREVVCCIL